jgi:ketosteroid isomerase-like protein
MTRRSGEEGAALRVALDYFDAWTGKDFERAMTFVSDDIVCDAPAGRIEGAAAYRAFMGPFVQILESATLISAFGDDETAVVVYETATVPVKSAPGAECVTVEDGRITRSRFVFDRLPFQAAR